MRQLDKQSLHKLLKELGIKFRLINEVRFSPDDIPEYDDIELLAIQTRSGNMGVLLIEADKTVTALPYNLLGRLVDPQTGRAKSVICDFCSTQQTGGNAARITLPYPDRSGSISYLCCGDLRCSDHVRDKTPESVESRKQLREDLTIEQRVDRLKRNLMDIVERYEQRI